LEVSCWKWILDVQVGRHFLNNVTYLATTCWMKSCKLHYIQILYVYSQSYWNTCYILCWTSPWLYVMVIWLVQLVYNTCGGDVMVNNFSSVVCLNTMQNWITQIYKLYHMWLTMTSITISESQCDEQLDSRFISLYFDIIIYM